MANLKFVIVLGMLFAISAAVLAETSKDETHVQKMNPTETTQVEPQQANCGCGRRRRCCGACAFGTQCSACCASKLAEAEEEAIVVEPQQASCGCGRHRRCCGACAFGRCSTCC